MKIVLRCVVQKKKHNNNNNKAPAREQVIKLLNQIINPCLIYCRGHALMSSAKWRLKKTKHLKIICSGEPHVFKMCLLGSFSSLMKIATYAQVVEH